MNRIYNDWVPCGYTLSTDPKMQMLEFKHEHPDHHGLVRFTPQADGFVKVEFKGEVRK